MSNSNTGAGISLFGVAIFVTIVFAILKWLGVIAWSWWTVFIPIWVVLGLSVASLIIWFFVVIVIAGIFGLVDRRSRKK